METFCISTSTIRACPYKGSVNASDVNMLSIQGRMQTRRLCSELAAITAYMVYIIYEQSLVITKLF